MIAWIQIDGESKNKTKLKNESNGFFKNGLKRITVVYKTDNVDIYIHRIKNILYLLYFLDFFKPSSIL